MRWRRIQSSIWVIFPSFVTEFTPTPQRRQHLQLTRRLEDVTNLLAICCAILDYSNRAWNIHRLYVDRHRHVERAGVRCHKRTHCSPYSRQPFRQRHLRAVLLHYSIYRVTGELLYSTACMAVYTAANRDDISCKWSIQIRNSTTATPPIYILW